MEEQISSFIETLQKKYDLNIDDNEEENVVNMRSLLGEIKLNIHIIDKTFDIYMDFPFYDEVEEGDEEEYSNEIQGISEVIFSRELNRFFNRKPKHEDEIHYLCPGSNEYVGFWDNLIDISIVDTFFRAVNSYHDKYQTILPREDTISSIIQAYLKLAQEFLFDHGFKKDKDIFNEDNDIYIGKQNRIVLTTIQHDIVQLFAYGSAFSPIINHYHGDECFIAKAINSENMISTNIDNVKLFYNLHDELNIFTEFEYYTDSKKFVYIKSKFFHQLVVIDLRSNISENLEYDLLIQKLNFFKPFKNKNTIDKIDFSKLNPDDFEKLCFDLLQQKGFINIHPVGKTNAPDGGCDIFADEEVQGVFGSEIRHWIFQCKHSKSSLNRKDVAEIPDLLREYNADKYGLFCSNSLTPEAIKRLQSLNEKHNGIVKYWGIIELGAEISQFPELIRKHSLI
jgi:hypothetical protein